MKKSAVLMRVLAIVGLLAACPRPAAAFIKVEPWPLGKLCREATHIYVLKVDKVSQEKGVILFKRMEQLKGTPDGTVPKHVIKPNAKGAQVVLDWAAEGKTLVMLVQVSRADKGDGPGYGRGHAVIDGYWYSITYEGQCWTLLAGEPSWLSQYCGTADKLQESLKKILRGEEVVVPAMVSGNKEDLEQRRARVYDLRASLKILDADPRQNAGSDKNPKDKGNIEKKPSDKNPGDSEPGLVGTVKAVSSDGKSFTLLRPPTAKRPEPSPIDIQLTERTTITLGKEPGKLAVGQSVRVWLGKAKSPSLRLLR